MKQAKAVAWKMHNSMPQWRLLSCIDLLCNGAEVAVCTLAQIMGGVMEVSKTSTTSTASVACAQDPGISFYIGDSAAPEVSRTDVDVSSKSILCT